MANTPKKKTDRRGAPGKPKSQEHREAISQAMIQHGMRANTRLGKLPAKLQYVEHRVNAFRRTLEAAVIKAKREVNLTDACTINSACKWERHGALAQYWLRTEEDKLSVGDRLKFHEASAKASDQRDKNIRLLQLDRDAAANVIDALYGKLSSTPVEDEDDNT